MLAASTLARLVIIGQAPGAKVHESGVPWHDASGRQLREWLDVDDATFYDSQCIALVPMGFCFPGRGTAGDLPPRSECAPLWHDQLLRRMHNAQLTLLIGQYSQRYYLGSNAGENLTETVRNFRVYLPRFLPLPHPSPRNRPWLAKNGWFERELVPALRRSVREALS